METGSLLWIGGIAVVAIAGCCILRNNAHQKRRMNVACKQAELKVEKNMKVERTTSKETPKKVFIDNIETFVPLFDDLARGACSLTAWTEKIVDINHDALTDIWRKYTAKPEQLPILWKRQIEAWGVRCDTCKKFTYISGRNVSYVTEDGEKPIDGKHYQVVSPSWILTLEAEDGSITKKIIKAGIIKLSEHNGNHQDA